MSTSTGERHSASTVAAVCLALLLLPGGACAAETAMARPAWSQDFEDRVPGQSPMGWGGIWGKPGDDLLLVSNLRAVSGRQALLLDRTGSNTEMWGVAVVFPDLWDGWLRVAFAFLVQGAGNDARFGFEIRERLPSGRRVAGLGFAASRIRLTPMSETGAYLADQSVALGAFEKDVWHRVELWLPTRGGADARVVAQLSRYVGGGGWEATGPQVQVPGTPPAAQAAYGQLMLVLTPGARGYRLFLDDLQAGAVTAPASAPGSPD